MKGDVKLCSDIVLRNVFYVLDLQCNLIFVIQLTDDMSCVLFVTKIFCVIQDLHLRTLIGASERRDGLYYFRDFPRIGAMNIDGVSSDLWHQHLGHPSYKVLRSLPFLVKSCIFSKKTCGLCHLAKQTRDKFPISDNKATKCFEIIHCNLWGKYHMPSSCGATDFLTLVDDYSRAVWVYPI